jgi:hypothetical protein
MSFSGTGTFNINSSGQPVVAGTTITATAFNALTADLATGLSTCITKDGQQTVTANIPFANYRLTGVGAGTSGTDAANVAQVQGSASALVTVSGTDTLTGSMTPALTAYATGNQFAFVAANTNTTAVTLNIDGLGAKAVTRDGSTALVAGDIISGKAQLVVYDGTRFQLLNSPSFTNLRTTGNVTVAAPASGVALTITGQSGANIANFQAAATSDAGIIFGITSSQQWNLRTTYSDGSFRLYDQTRVAYPLIVSTTGEVTIAAPSSGDSLTVSGSSFLNGNVLTQAGATFYNATGNLFVRAGTGGDLRLGANGTNSLVTIDTSGNLGLGVTPNAWYVSRKAFDIGAASSFSAYAVGIGAASEIWTNAYLNASAVVKYKITDYATRCISINGEFRWETAPLGTAGNTATLTQVMTLDNSGNLGLGTTTIGNRVTISDLGTGMGFVNAASGNFNVGLLGGTSSAIAYIYQRANAALIFGTNNTEVARFDASGNLGLGTAPSSKLHVLGTAAGTAALRIDTSAAVGSQTATWTAPTNKPGAASGVVTKWIPINLDGTTYYIPAWT